MTFFYTHRRLIIGGWEMSCVRTRWMIPMYYGIKGFIWLIKVWSALTRRSLNLILVNLGWIFKKGSCSCHWGKLTPIHFFTLRRLSQRRPRKKSQHTTLQKSHLKDCHWWGIRSYEIVSIYYLGYFKGFSSIKTNLLYKVHEVSSPTFLLCWEQ